MWRTSPRRTWPGRTCCRGTPAGGVGDVDLLGLFRSQTWKGTSAIAWRVMYLQRCVRIRFDAAGKYVKTMPDGSKAARPHVPGRLAFVAAVLLAGVAVVLAVLGRLRPLLVRWLGAVSQEEMQEMQEAVHALSARTAG